MECCTSFQILAHIWQQFSFNLFSVGLIERLFRSCFKIIANSPTILPTTLSCPLYGAEVQVRPFGRMGSAMRKCCKISELVESWGTIKRSNPQKILHGANCHYHPHLVVIRYRIKCTPILLHRADEREQYDESNSW